MQSWSMRETGEKTPAAIAFANRETAIEAGLGQN
jgi:hypothetical protein